jgi:hypothetical protein
VTAPPEWATYVAFAGAMVIVAGAFYVMVADICARRRPKPPNTLGRKKERPSNR